jgi:hypothetical protein
VVRQLLETDVPEDQVRRALMAAPAWTPSSLQVELDRGRTNGNGTKPPAASTTKRGTWSNHDFDPLTEGMTP